MKLFIIILLSVFYFLECFSQKFHFPDFENRDSKLITILSVENTLNSTDIEFEYMCPYISKFDSTYFTFNANTVLSTESKIYKLLDAENINIAPSKSWCTEKGARNKFKLIFEKIDDTVKSFNIIECPQNTECFNFYGVQLKNFSHLIYDNDIKDDIFLTFFPPDLRLYFRKGFNIISPPGISLNKMFESYIERKYDSNKYLNDFYSDIKFDKNANTNKYTLKINESSVSLKYNEVYNPVSSIELYIPQILENKIPLIRLKFNDSISLNKFTNSFIKFWSYSTQILFNETHIIGRKIFLDANGIELKSFIVNYNVFNPNSNVIYIFVLNNEENKEFNINPKSLFE